MIKPERNGDGQAPIGGYAVLGDGRGTALVALDGVIDWWAIPAIDSTPPFAALIDPEGGGSIRLSPSASIEGVERRYLPDTNVLETTMTTATGTVRITDALNTGIAGRLPWTELGRRVEGVSGTVEMELDVSAGTGLGVWSPWVDDTSRGLVVHTGPVILGVLASDGIDLGTDGKSVTARFTVEQGERRTVGVVGSYDEPLFLTDVSSVDSRLDRTVQGWQAWSGQVGWEGTDRGAVLRSALALKLLIASHTGAIAAAATTSLPERIGGDKNWDYRFAWVRDASFTIDALQVCGLQEEVHAAASWLLGAIQSNGPHIHIMYTLEGGRAGSASPAPVPGYRGSTPVLIGNGAASQTQLGVYGDLFGTIDSWVRAGHVLDTGTRRLLADLADECADAWRGADAGIWELGTSEQYTSSKINCWRAMDLAASLAENGHLPGSGVRWRQEAQIIRDWVQENCWSEKLRSYTCYAGGDTLDVSVALGARFGFDTGERMSATIDALREHLGAGPLVYRYTGMADEESAFIACSYWLVEA
ncbi:MAG: glycoside hydrolase family 15 protein, partial [Mycobacteriaceae bacterium]